MKSRVVPTLVTVPVCLAMLVAVAAHAPAALAAVPNTWGPPAALPSGSVPNTDEPNGDLLLGTTDDRLMRYSLQETIPETAFFEADGTLGAAQRVTGSEPEGGNGPVAYLPGGAAVISVVPEAGKPLSLTVRSASGAYGPLFAGTSGRPIKAVAAREGEVLIARERTGTAGKPLIEVATLALDSSGTLTETGSQVIYEMPAEDTFVAHFKTVGLALGPDGSADLVMLTENEGRTGGSGAIFARNEVFDFHRAAAGGPWSGATNLAAGLPDETEAQELQFAASPGGRAIFAFKTSEPIPVSSSLRPDASHLYAAVREPEGAFSAPVLVVAPTSPEEGAAQVKTMAAAGPDGTLALAYRTETCQSITPITPAETYGVEVAAPGQGLSAFSLAGKDTADGTSRITALGAGHGQALIGVDDREVVVGEGNNLCEYSPIPNDQTERYDDRAIIVGAAEPLDGDEFATLEKTLGQTEGEPFHGVGGEPYIDTAAIDEGGDAAVTGALTVSGGAEYAYFTGSGKAYGGGPLGTGGTGGTGDTGGGDTGGGEGTTGGGRSVGGSGTSGSTGSSGKSTGSKPATADAPAPKVGALDVSASGHATLTLTAPKLSGSGRLLVKIELAIVSGKGKGAKTIAKVNAVAHLGSGQKTTLHLALPPKAAAYLRSHGGRGAQIRIVVSRPGEAPRTVTISPRASVTG
jgi:hypothetical protein